MKKYLSWLIIAFAPLACFSQAGKVSDNLTLKSKLLNMDRKFAIYLPPDYESSQRNYPVLYLLHGGGDDQTGWVQFGEVLNITDKAIREGTATPMVIVMPDANTTRRGYANDVTNTWRYEDFFFQELMPYIEKTYRVKTEKRFRAIAGLSMGGDGTFTYALHHPELFAAACPLSAGTGPANLDSSLVRFKRDKSTASEAEITAFYKRQSVLELVNNLPDSSKKAVRWYIDCGDDDFLFEGNSLVHIAMRKKQIPHEFRIRDGGHNWTYWRTALPEVLQFVSMSFHQF
ncbi:MAG: alpha/beta hydrolase-fold protein [Bacteroidota bacterium]|nr:alpha/beta hydrolase-fold protein [Ferruginibacter sp.]